MKRIVLALRRKRFGKHPARTIDACPRNRQADRRLDRSRQRSHYLPTATARKSV
ncbi:MAG: hypothetical protein MZU97_03530 [Bacillus subtilis]|nr:hypothetical protein [Bacillus subtilis]